MRIVWSHSQRVLLWGKIWNRALGQHQAGRTQAQGQDSSLELRIGFWTSPLPWYIGRILTLQLSFTFNFWIHFPMNLHKGHYADTQCWLGRYKGDWAQDSRRILSYITVCDYDITYLQENPQKLGWGSWRDILHYILGLHSLYQGQCDRSYTSVFKYYFSNTWTGLGHFRVSLCSSGMEIELSPYRHFP